MPLLNLPSEIISLIFQHLGGNILRTSANNLLVCKQWYLSAHPIYLSNLDLTALYLSAWDLSRLPPVHSALGSLIQANVKQLSLRLVGRPSRQKARRPWFTNPESDDDEDQDEVKDYEDWGIVTEYSSGSVKLCKWTDYLHDHLLEWRNSVNQQIESFAEILSGCKALEELSLEISDAVCSDRCDFIYDSSLENIISSLPKWLERLTFDTCGSKVLSYAGDDAAPVHLCPLLAQRLGDIQHVRLRMRNICTDALRFCGKIEEGTLQLRSLIVRLTLPMFPHKDDKYSAIAFDTLPCIPPSGKPKKSKLWKDMARVGINVAKDMPRIENFRISYREDVYSKINLYAVDCLTRNIVYDPAENFCYEDEGEAWDGWEEGELWQGTQFQYG